jgi:hypothetical protein
VEWYSSPFPAACAHAGHSFCRGCLRKSLQHSQRCPKCREQMPGEISSQIPVSQLCLQGICQSACHIPMEQNVQISPCAVTCSLAVAAGSKLLVNTALWNTILLLFPKNAASAPVTPPEVLAAEQRTGTQQEIDLNSQGMNTTTSLNRSQLPPALLNPFRPPWQQAAGAAGGRGRQGPASRPRQSMLPVAWQVAPRSHALPQHR